MFSLNNNLKFAQTNDLHCPKFDTLEEREAINACYEETEKNLNVTRCHRSSTQAYPASPCRKVFCFLFLKKLSNMPICDWFGNVWSFHVQKCVQSRIDFPFCSCELKLGAEVRKYFGFSFSFNMSSGYCYCTFTKSQKNQKKL